MRRPPRLLVIVMILAALAAWVVAELAQRFEVLAPPGPVQNLRIERGR